MTQDDLKSAIKKIQAKINQSLANGELSNGLTFSSKDIDYTKKGLY